MEDQQQRVEVIQALFTGGRQGIALGDSIEVNNEDWTPVLWDDQDEPEFFRTDGLRFIP